MPQKAGVRTRLLAHHDVPAETHDEVLSIFSAAAICANPSASRLDVECLIAPGPRIHELGRDRME